MERLRTGRLLILRQISPAINSRGDEAMGSVWSYLDVTPLGRQEDWENSPESYPQTPRYKWWRWHDAYGNEDAKWANVIDNAVVTLKL